MKTLTVKSRQRTLRLFLLCFAILAAALMATIADADTLPAPQATKEFWVWDLRVMPPAFRRATATLRATGDRSMIYVENSLYGTNVTQGFVNRLAWQLEHRAPDGAYLVDTGVLTLEERLFGALPKKISRDDRLTVLFADLGQYQNTQFDGFFNQYDQLPDAEAMQKYQQHSNEANLIYVNGLRRNESYTGGVIAHELQHLLASGATSAPRESWLSEMLAEGAMLLTGFYGDQDHVNRYLQDPGKASLVTPGYVQYGPQMLFSAFLLDSLPLAPGTSLSVLNGIPLQGRDAVEKLFRDLTDAPLSFDAIFSSFVSYVFQQSESATNLPSAWHHPGGVYVPAIPAYYTFRASSGELTGGLAPYSFVAIDLAQELSSSAVIQVSRDIPVGVPAPGSCAMSGSVLWKPVSKTRLAVYAVGCDPGERPETLQFRLRILDQPSLNTAGPFRLLR